MYVCELILDYLNDNTCMCEVILVCVRGVMEKAGHNLEITMSMGESETEQHWNVQ